MTVPLPADNFEQAKENFLVIVRSGSVIVQMKTFKTGPDAKVFANDKVSEDPAIVAYVLQLHTLFYQGKTEPEF